MTEYRYFKDSEGKICRLHLEQDTEPSNPRYDWDGNIGKMMCWHRSYNLGDYKENNYSDNEDFLNDMVRDCVPEKAIINFVKSKKTSNGLELRYNRKEQLWELWGYYYWSLFGEKHEPKFDVIESNNPIDYLIYDIIEAMSQEDKWKLLERCANIVYLPLYLYDHSGITMNTGGFSCRWDSGQVGYIYTDKNTILKTVGAFKNEKGNYIKVNEKNWKKAAYKSMEDEVHTYDMYLTGEVYGLVVEELVDEEDDEWNETDSCWDFYNDSWGDKLFEEVARDFGISEELFDSLEEVAQEVPVMMPIVRTEMIKSPFSGRSFKGNIVLDKLGRECTWIADGYYLLKKNGTVGKRKTNEWQQKNRFNREIRKRGNDYESNCNI